MKAKKKFPFEVCKPCWELHYCPYGPIVEKFPLTDGDVTQSEVAYAKKRFSKAKASLRKGIKNRIAFSAALDELDYFYPDHWQMLAQYDSANLQCRCFGHTCPVFFYAEGITETKKRRRTGRHIPREIMFQVVRRDDYTCQLCLKRVEDRDVHFDHIIPISKGGSTETHNLRLLCSRCNRTKSDSVEGILQPNIR